MRVGYNIIGFSEYRIANDNNFPDDECTECSNDESGIFESSNWYECVLINIAFPENGFSIRVLSPYKCVNTDSGELFGYGWRSSCKDIFYDNAYLPIHNDNEVVIAFKKTELNVPLNIVIDGFREYVLKNRIDDLRA